jgi:hypothetical protein
VDDHEDPLDDEDVDRELPDEDVEEPPKDRDEPLDDDEPPNDRDPPEVDEPERLPLLKLCPPPGRPNAVTESKTKESNATMATRRLMPPPRSGARRCRRRSPDARARARRRT